MPSGRLEGGFYGSVEAWRADVDLVWSNAMRFNEPTNDVHECAKKLAQAFDRMMRQVMGVAPARVSGMRGAGGWGLLVGGGGQGVIAWRGLWLVWVGDEVPGVAEWFVERLVQPCPQCTPACCSSCADGAVNPRCGRPRRSRKEAGRSPRRRPCRARPRRRRPWASEGAAGAAAQAGAGGRFWS